MQVHGNERVAPSGETQFTPNLTLFNGGEAVEFEIDGEPGLGEVVEVDDGRNVARVMLIPSGKVVLMQQDHLQKVATDALARLPQNKVPAGEPVVELPEPGALF